jgi:hypothetical protein
MLIISFDDDATSDRMRRSVQVHLVEEAGSSHSTDRDARAVHKSLTLLSSWTQVGAMHRRRRYE